MNIQDEIKYKLAPFRISKDIVTAVHSLYTQIRMQEHDILRHFQYTKATVPAIFMNLYVDSINNFTFSYNEFLETTLNYYSQIYAQVVNNLHFIETASLNNITVLGVSISLSGNDVSCSILIHSGAILVDGSSLPIPISELKAVIAAQNDQSQLHNRRLFTETCSPEVVSMRRTHRNVRQFADELLYKPDVGKLYFEAKNRFEAESLRSMHQEDDERIEITRQQMRNLAIFAHSHDRRDRLVLGTEEDEARRRITERQMRRFSEFVRAHNQQGGYRQTKKRNYRVRQRRTKAKNSIRIRTRTRNRNNTRARARVRARARARGR